MKYFSPFATPGSYVLVTPDPKGFIMHNRFYKKGTMEEQVMWWRYTKLTNKSRFPEEKRLIKTVYGQNGERFR